MASSYITVIEKYAVGTLILVILAAMFAACVALVVDEWRMSERRDREMKALLEELRAARAAIKEDDKADEDEDADPNRHCEPR